MWGKVKLRATDTLYSKYIRRKANWTCEICGKYCGENNSLHKLENSHFYSRRNESTRFDDDNCMALCFTCHANYGHGELRPKYEEIMIKRLGQNGFDALLIRKNSIHKRDDKMDMIIIKEKIKMLEEAERGK